jgi:hypothetical protein
MPRALFQPRARRIAIREFDAGGLKRGADGGQLRCEDRSAICAEDIDHLTKKPGHR